MKTCSNCGHANADSEIFCVKCNHYLAWDEPRRTPERGPEEAEAEGDEVPPQDAVATDAPPVSEPEAPPTPLPPPAIEVPNAEPSPRRTEPAEVPAPSRHRRRRSPVADVLAAIDEGARLASERERGDLVARLHDARAALTSRRITVAVAGEFKRGKSTLINALLQTDVCPTDADIVTAVPTLIRYGNEVVVTAFVESGDNDVEARQEDVNRLPDLVMESWARTREPVRSVEVQFRHPILASGLCLVDTPGVGGLESEHGQITLAGLNGADALLFVTDASQELTAPELDFLLSAIERIPSAALVVTKTDLYPWWRRIVEINRDHLTAAGLDLPIVAVSSFLRLRAAREAEPRRSALNDESGFERLVEHLATGVVVPAKERTAAELAHEVDFAMSQLAHEADAERVVLARPDEGEKVISTLAQADRKAKVLGSGTWQQLLTDGIQDLVSDVEYDLQQRLRDVLRHADEVIDQEDPLESWPDVEAWLRRQVASAGLANRDLMLERARELSDSVATQFDLDVGQDIEIPFDELSQALAALEIQSPSTLGMRRGRLNTFIVGARSTVFVPMIIFSLAPGSFPLLAVAAVALSLGAGIGTKLIKDEAKRKRQQRQREAKAAARKYLDEVAVVMSKEARDRLRLTQRALRDEFRGRAVVIGNSTGAAVRSAQQAVRLTDGERQRRSESVAAQATRLGDIRARMTSIAATAGPAGEDGVVDD